MDRARVAGEVDRADRAEHMFEDRREFIREACATAFAGLAPVAAADGQRIRHPLAGCEGLPFTRTLEAMRILRGARAYMSLEDFQAARAGGEITDAAMHAAIANAIGPQARAPFVVGGRSFDRVTTFRRIIERDRLEDAKADKIRLALEQRLAPMADDLLARYNWAGEKTSRAFRMVSAICDSHFATSIAQRIDVLSDRYVTAFLADGDADYAMPHRNHGFYSAWRRLALHDTVAATQIDHYQRRVRALPQLPHDALYDALERLGRDESEISAYLELHAFRQPGISGFIKHRVSTTGDATSIDAVGYLAVRVWLEAALVETFVQRSRRVASIDAIIAADAAMGRDDESVAIEALLDRVSELLCATELAPFEIAAMSDDDLRRVCEFATTVAPENHAAVRLDAAEISARATLYMQLAQTTSGESDELAVPLIEVHCPDIPAMEPFRRRLEMLGGYRTRGTDAFYGVRGSLVLNSSGQSRALCPMIVEPRFEVVVIPEQRAVHFSAKKLQRFAGSLHSTMKRLRNSEPHTAHTQVVALDREGRAADLATRVAIARDVLLGLNKTTGFLPVNVFLSYENSTPDTLSLAAENFDTCRGYGNTVNTKFIVSLLNASDVRAGLLAQGLEIPNWCVFVGLRYDERPNRIRVDCYLELPAYHQNLLELLARDAREAQRAVINERTRHRAATKSPTPASISDSPLLVIAPRERTRGRDFKGLVALHDYRAEEDLAGQRLAMLLDGTVMHANDRAIRRYCSSPAGRFHGELGFDDANLVGRIGFTLGAEGDFRTGDPQSTGEAESTAAVPYIPRRLSVIVAAPRATIERALAMSPRCSALCANGWLSLVDWDAAEGEHAKFVSPGVWRSENTRVRATDVPEVGQKP